jgi:hypothetical protein
MPDWSAFVADHSANTAGPMSDDRIEEGSIDLVLLVLICKTQRFGVPPSRVLWQPIMIWWHRPHI